MSQITRYISRLPHLARIQRRYRERTMIVKNDYIENLFVADYWRRKMGTPPGSVVECGTWRGGMFFGLMDLCPEVTEFHVFDSFEGLPPATAEVDGSYAVEAQAADELISNNNTAHRHEFDEGLNAHQGHRLDQVTVHQGWFEDTLEGFATKQPISVLRLDGDWYASTKVCLDALYDQVMPGGVILIDDYMQWDGCSRALHDFLSERQSRDRIRTSWRRGIAHIVKGHPKEKSRE